MNRTIKILLVILVGVIISGGSFLAGSMIGSRQAMTLKAAPVMGSLPFRGMNGPMASQPSDDTNSTGDPRPGKNFSGTYSGRNGQNDRNRDDQRQSTSGRNNFSGMPVRQSGAYMNPLTGDLMPHRFSTNFGGNNMSFGSLLVGGGMMFFGLLFPLGFAILMVLGIIVLFRMVRNPKNNMVAGTEVCAVCGTGVQIGWKHCPQCGTEIK